MVQNDLPGEVIRDARERAGLTQAHLAALVGVSQRTVGNWERGENPPSKHAARLRVVLALPGNDGPAPAVAPVTLEGASDAQLIAEIARRFGRRDA